MPAVSIQNAFVGLVNHADDNKMLLNISFPMNYVIIVQLASNLVYSCFDYTLQIFVNRCCALQTLGRLSTQNCQNLGCKILYVQLKNSISGPVLNRFQQS